MVFSVWLKARMIDTKSLRDEEWGSLHRAFLAQVRSPGYRVFARLDGRTVDVTDEGEPLAVLDDRDMAACGIPQQAAAHFGPISRRPDMYRIALGALLSLAVTLPTVIMPKAPEPVVEQLGEVESSKIEIVNGKPQTRICMSSGWHFRIADAATVVQGERASLVFTKGRLWGTAVELRVGSQALAIDSADR